MSMFTHGFSSFIGSLVPVTPFLILTSRFSATITTIILSFHSLDDIRYLFRNSIPK